MALSSTARGYMPIFLLSGKVLPAVMILFRSTSLLNWHMITMDSLAFHVLSWIQVCNQLQPLLFLLAHLSLSLSLVLWCNFNSVLCVNEAQMT